MRGVFEFPESLRPVQAVIDDALERVEIRFDTQLDSDLPPVRGLTSHVERYRGKMLRPSVAVLCALANERDIDERLAAGRAKANVETVTLGAVCEMVHMATLVHDDVLDEADVRRRGETINALRGNETAVILGDYLIASAYHLCCQIDDQAYAKEIGRVSMELCAGELLQLHNRDSFSLDEMTYFEIVKRKTGSLIGAACGLGARTGGASDRMCDAFREFGIALGVAFQVQDDLLDLLGEERTVGKSVNKDIEKGKMTLPMIHHLARATPEDRGKALSLLDAAGHSTEEAADARTALQAALESTGSITFAENEARKLVESAKSGIESLPETLPKLVLMLMADAVVARSF
ncbi:MAG: polyprenyl synthetase family protein [Planctomycetota bacterium]